MTATGEGLMTTQEVSTELGIPVGTLRYFRSTGKGPASFRLAGRIRYRRSEVLQWVVDQERATRRGGAQDEVA
ncbi:helix-turn-helix transcriptional regulator [Mycolicibacterium peregrinum]|uniref:helix-turn-helix transcriptional regulator n=1 Tax=Mycolicibacterium peregrinum TaxID=43304 RepID=UPI0007EBA6C5|nr:helix-turn-helix domain-containing protein [Mycolicibacterium peregrinum]